MARVYIHSRTWKLGLAIFNLSLNRQKFKDTISLSKTDCSSCRTQLGKSVNTSGDFGDENIKRVSDNDTVSVVPNKTAGGAEMDYWCCQWSGDTISVHMRHDVMAAEFLNRFESTITPRNMTLDRKIRIRFVKQDKMICILRKGKRGK